MISKCASDAQESFKNILFSESWKKRKNFVPPDDYWKFDQKMIKFLWVFETYVLSPFYFLFFRQVLIDEKTLACQKNEY